MTSDGRFVFGACGPFDEQEQNTIQQVGQALPDTERGRHLFEHVQQHIVLLDQLGSTLEGFPSLFAKQSLGKRTRDLDSLVDLLTKSNGSNYEMFLPTRALLCRNVVMAEMNFYRSLRFILEEARRDNRAQTIEDHGMTQQVERLLCHCLYTRLADEVLSHIASDEQVPRKERQKAVRVLTHIWERARYRIIDYLPVLEATWEARRRFRPTLGTLMGTSEMFQLMQAGCDERFVDYLVQHDPSTDEAGAFREFLFGVSSEQIMQLEKKLQAGEKSTVTTDDVDGAQTDPGRLSIDPALAMFEFFLSRHLQASARRQADLEGPKRTAEEYVMLHFLEEQEERSWSITPERL